uniref:Thioredoxin domain-containing protein n=1 Tax=Hyaloperonospora arabidopsidis (strain Emoy2) TaxID=559515 RepID=M4BB88_HYAAE
MMPRGCLPLPSLLQLLLLSVFAAASVKAEYGPRDAVVVLTEKNFEKEVLQSPDYWLVEFYAPWCGHCKKLEPEFKAAAKKLKKQARLGAVDATVHQQLAHKYKIKGYPTIKEFGAKKKRPQDYRGGRTAQEIVQYVQNSPQAKKQGVSSANVATLEFENVYAFLKADRPSAIFFGSQKTSKKKTPPTWMGSLAESFMEGTKKKRSSKVQLAYVPGSDGHIAEYFGLDEDQLPTIIYVYPVSQKYAVLDGGIVNEAVAKTFINDALANTEEAEQDELLPIVPLFPLPAMAKKKPVVALEELNVDTIRDCVAQQNKICVVVAKEDTNLVRSLAKKYRRDPFVFLASKPDAPVFQALTDFVGETADVIVMRSGRKMKYSALSGPSDESAISEFLDKLIDGTTPLSVVAGDMQTFAAAVTGASIQHEEL